MRVMGHLKTLDRMPGLDDYAWCKLFAKLVHTWVKFESELLESDSMTILEFLQEQGLLEGKINE